MHPLWDTSRVLPLDTPGAFWWEAANGARVLLWYDLHGSEWLPWGYHQALRELPGMLTALEQDGYAYDVVRYMVRGGHCDNAPPSLQLADLAEAWNAFCRPFSSKWWRRTMRVRGSADRRSEGNTYCQIHSLSAWGYLRSKAKGRNTEP